MRPVTLGAPIGSAQSQINTWIIKALRQIEQASNDTLINDTSSSGNALATVTGAAADQIAYFTGATSTAFTSLTAAGRALLALSNIAPTGGVVLMYRLPSSPSWIVVDGAGVAVNTAGTTTQGLQEAINTAAAQGLPLVVQGGGQTLPGGVETDWAQITCTTTVTIPAGTKASYTFNGISLLLNLAGAIDGLVFDSQDMTEFQFTGQIIYTGTASAVHFVPTNPNQEAFTGITSCTFDIRTLVCVVSAANLAPDATKGLCARLSAASGVIVNNRFLIGECNAGIVGIQIDNPGASKSVNFNYFNMPALHASSSVEMQIGTSASGTAIYGNVFDAIGGGTGQMLNDWGINNFYRLSIESGTIGIVLNTSVANSIYDAAYNNASTKISDASTAKSSFVRGAGAGQAFSKAANGYARLDSGIILQWGTTGVINANSGATITFPQAFPTAIGSITVTQNGGLTANLAAPGTNTVTTSNFVLNNNHSTGQIFKWMAIGW